MDDSRLEGGAIEKQVEPFGQEEQKNRESLRDSLFFTSLNPVVQWTHENKKADHWKLENVSKQCEGGKGKVYCY